MGLPAVELLEQLIKANRGAKYAGEVLSAFKGAESPVSSEVTKSETSPNGSLSPQLLAEPLTKRQLQILELLAQGLQNKEIGEKLFVSPDTVRSHLRNIYSKLSVSSRLEAVTKAAGLGILTAVDSS
jgi:LuxR family maltose regulon positive regulatory protein